MVSRPRSALGLPLGRVLGAVKASGMHEQPERQRGARRLERAGQRSWRIGQPRERRLQRGRGETPQGGEGKTRSAGVPYRGVQGGIEWRSGTTCLCGHGLPACEGGFGQIVPVLTRCRVSELSNCVSDPGQFMPTVGISAPIRGGLNKERGSCRGSPNTSQKRYLTNN